MLTEQSPSTIIDFFSKTKWEETKKPIPSYETLLNEVWTEGVKTGMRIAVKTQKATLVKKFQENFLGATNTSELLYSRLNKETNLGCNKMFLKIHNIKIFETLIVVSFDSYLTPNRQKGYEIARQIKNETKNKNFSIIFTFLPETKSLNIKSVSGDGFFFKYAPKSQKVSTR